MSAAAAPSPVSPHPADSGGWEVRVSISVVCKCSLREISNASKSVMYRLWEQMAFFLFV